MDNNKLWDIIDELRKENNELKCELDAYSNLIIENKELKNIIEELRMERKLSYNKCEEENKELKTKLNETISCKDYESEAREYFSHNPQGDKVSFFMFDDDYINTYDIDESLEICTIYNDNI
tara:strand:+ start:3454 stop:3819 length:366 start_codon:yes stop_codon:yes gene_type:complete